MPLFPARSTVSPRSRLNWQSAFGAPIKEVGYVPNTQARALVSGRSRILGLVVSEITNPFFPELVQEFENLAVEQGYEVFIGSTNYEPSAPNRSSAACCSAASTAWPS